MSLVEARMEIVPAAAGIVEERLLEREAVDWSVHEDVLLGRAWIIGIFSTATEAKTSSAQLQAALPTGTVAGKMELRELPESEWRDSYKAHFHAWQFGRLHWVPVWERNSFRLPENDAVLWLDPGLAFGTGNHETTRLCVERLVEFAQRNGTAGRVIDAGCGSGILALSAARLGFGNVLGFDSDPEAVRVSEENAVLNELEGRVAFFVGDVAGSLRGVQAELVMANILADVLIRHAKELTEAIAPGGTLALSGILAAECKEVRTAFLACASGWAQESRTMSEWSDLILVRPLEQ